MKKLQLRQAMSETHPYLTPNWFHIHQNFGTYMPQKGLLANLFRSSAGQVPSHFRALDVHPGLETVTRRR